MATTVTGIPVEEYLRTSYEPEMEYVNRQLVELFRQLDEPSE